MNETAAVRLRVLSDVQVERIYAATLECLERTGVHVLNTQARRLLAGAGGKVDGVRVRIGHKIIEDALSLVPRDITIYGRDPRFDMNLRPGAVHFGPGPSCTYFIDPFTGERRAPNRHDPGLTARVCDALPNIDYVMGLGTPLDVPPDVAPVYEFAAMVANTGKPLMAWGYTPDNMCDIYRIAVAAAGSEAVLLQRPFYAIFACSQPPLIHPDDVLANVLWAVDQGIPVVYHGGGSPGASAPITGAGAMVVSLAMELSGLAILQLRRPGAVVCVGGVPAPTDPRTARPAYGGPELSLYTAGLAEVCEHLGLAFMGTAGASEAKTLDLQAAIESTGQVIFSQLTGSGMPHDVGFLDCADIGSLDMLVMTDEIIGMARRMTRGIQVSDESLMLDVIDEVGPGGEFLSHMTTARGCRREVWLPKLMDRQPYDGWLATGGEEMAARVRTRVRHLVTTHQPPPLPTAAPEQIARILAEAEARQVRTIAGL